MVHAESFTLATRGFCDVVDISGKVAQAAERAGVAAGAVTVFCPGVGE